MRHPFRGVNLINCSTDCAAHLPQITILATLPHRATSKRATSACHTGGVQGEYKGNTGGELSPCIPLVFPLYSPCMARACRTLAGGSMGQGCEDGDLGKMRGAIGAAIN